jgi:peptidoglycan-associated lipoprotein
MLESRPQARVLIEGHCDERGTVEYNLALGEKRAQAVKEYLVTYGVEGERLDTVSYGEERPLDPRSTEEAWAKNRRAHMKER